jgi:ferritin-like metal-binding protein YciE
MGEREVVKLLSQNLAQEKTALAKIKTIAKQLAEASTA